MNLIDYINAWDVVTIKKQKNDNFKIYDEEAKQLRAIVGDKPTILWLSISNGPLFGSASFVAIDDSGKVLAEINVLVE